MKYNNCVKIFYTQENLCPDFNYADYAIGFDNIEFEDRYLQFPIYYIPERYKESWDLMMLKHKNIYNNLKTQYLFFKYWVFSSQFNYKDKPLSHLNIA